MRTFYEFTILSILFFLDSITDFSMRTEATRKILKSIIDVQRKHVVGRMINFLKIVYTPDFFQK